MSIYAKTWEPDEEITSDKLNQMSADISNETDNIHPQYENLPDYTGLQFELFRQYVTTTGFVAIHPTGTYYPNPPQWYYRSIPTNNDVYYYERLNLIKRSNTIRISGHLGIDDSGIIGAMTFYIGASATNIFSHAGPYAATDFSFDVDVSSMSNRNSGFRLSVTGVGYGGTMLLSNLKFLFV